jgi:hypothetical protein
MEISMTELELLAQKAAKAVLERRQNPQPIDIERLAKEMTAPNN